MARTIDNSTARGVAPTTPVRDVRGVRQKVSGFTGPLALTDSFQAVGSFIAGTAFAKIRWMLQTTTGDVTSITFRTEVDGKDKSDGYAKYDTDGTLSDTTITKADLDTSNGRAAVSRGLDAAGRVRLLAKRTGGTTASLDTAEFIIEEQR